MRFADQIVTALESMGVTRCFMVTGGAAMHLNDAFRASKCIEVVCLHHEQSCAMAAEAYFKLSGKVAAVCVTAGPGALNTLNGVWGSFADSAALIVVAGNCRTDHLSEEMSSVVRPRLFGDQDCPTKSIVTPMVKDFHRSLSGDSSDLSRCKEVFRAATLGRPGPVWVEVPIDVQSATIECFEATCEETQDKPNILEDPVSVCRDIMARLLKSLKPVIIIGSGIRYSGSQHLILEFASEMHIPILPVWNSIDLVPNDHPCFAGRPGADGDRGGNFVQQAADLILILGARMHVRQTGFDFDAFGRGATEVLMVDIDAAELAKPNLRLTQKYCADLRYVAPQLLKEIPPRTVESKNNFKEFLEWAKKANKRFSILNEHEATIEGSQTINPYLLIDHIFRSLDTKVPVVTSDGTAAVITQKVAYISEGRRVITNKGCASMGYELPAAIGVFESTREPVVCIAGDGSLMMNIQELAVIGGRELPILIILLNNGGYHSIRQTQEKYFENNSIGCGVDSGLHFPSFKLIAAAFGLGYHLMQDNDDIYNHQFNRFCQLKKPSIVEVVVDQQVRFTPRMKTIKLPDQSLVSLPLEDMDPLLPEAELSEWAPNYKRPKIVQ